MRRSWMTLGLLAAAGCGGGCEPDAIGGEIGNGAFHYECAGHTDAYCETELFGSPAGPSTLAVGAEFALSFDDSALFGGSGSLVPASQAVLYRTRDGFAFARAGFGAVLARTHAEVIDFLHLDGADVAFLDVAAVPPGRIHGDGPRQRITARGSELPSVAEVALRVGERRLLVALPLEADGHLLGGSLDYVWEVEPAELAAPLDARDNVLAIDGLAAGSGLLRVRAAGLVRELALEVTP